MTITTQSPCSTFPSGNYSPGLQIFLTIRQSILLTHVGQGLVANQTAAPSGLHRHKTALAVAVNSHGAVKVLRASMGKCA